MSCSLISRCDIITNIRRCSSCPHAPVSPGPDCVRDESGVVRRRGVMNATEQAWADKLEADPLVRRYRFEEVTLTVGGGEHGKRPKRFTPDFVVTIILREQADYVEVHEVKGRHRHRRRGVETLKAAAKQYPEFLWFLVERDGDGWKKTPII